MEKNYSNLILILLLVFVFYKMCINPSRSETATTKHRVEPVNLESQGCKGSCMVNTDNEKSDYLKDTLSDLKKICEECSKDKYICTEDCMMMKKYCDYLGYSGSAPYVPCTGASRVVTSTVPSTILDFDKIMNPISLEVDDSLRPYHLQPCGGQS